MKAIVALGTNLGDRRYNLEAGLLALADLGRVTASPLVTETADESGRGPDYLNTVALLDADRDDARQLLEELLRIELRLGRDRRTGRNAPRTLDLDLIAVEGTQGHWEWPAPEGLECLGEQLHLTLPHPKAHLRYFVVEPWRALPLTEGLQPPV